MKPRRDGDFLFGEYQDPQSLKTGVVYGLLADLVMATKIAKAAQNCFLRAQHFDAAGSPLDHIKIKVPRLLIFDWEVREADAYRVLAELQQNADWKRIPSVGYCSSSKLATKTEAERAGCHRVFFKTEFLRDLEQILMRYAL